MSGRSESLVGATLAQGRYHIRAKLGEGGMGLVYLARDANLDTSVVVKMPRRAMLADAELVDRFAREVRALVQLRHPHIVKVSDVGEHEGVPFAVMDYLPGGSLEDRHGLGDAQGGRPADPCELVGWLPSIAMALDFAHAQGYVHRDVKPANILFDSQGNAFLGDFGVAKLIAVSQEQRTKRMATGTGMILGTPGYMAPEVILGAAPDGRSDQYALGVVAYEVLTGQCPYNDVTPTARLVKQTTTDPSPAHRVRQDLSAGLAGVVARAMSRDPNVRFADCASFARAVIAEIPARSSAAVAATVATTAARWIRLFCPGCDSPLRIPPAAAGKNIRCPGCSAKLAVAQDLSGLVEATAAGIGTVAISGLNVPTPRTAGEPAQGRRTVLEPVQATPGTIVPPGQGSRTVVESVPASRTAAPPGQGQRTVVESVQAPRTAAPPGQGSRTVVESVQASRTVVESVVRATMPIAPSAADDDGFVLLEPVTPPAIVPRGSTVRLGGDRAKRESAASAPAGLSPAQVGQIVAAAALSVLLCGIGGFAWWNWRRAEPAHPLHVGGAETPARPATLEAGGRGPARRAGPVAGPVPLTVPGAESGELIPDAAARDKLVMGSVPARRPADLAPAGSAGDPSSPALGEPAPESPNVEAEGETREAAEPEGPPPPEDGPVSSTLSSEISALKANPAAYANKYLIPTEYLKVSAQISKLDSGHYTLHLRDRHGALLADGKTLAREGIVFLVNPDVAGHLNKLLSAKGVRPAYAADLKGSLFLYVHEMHLNGEPRWVAEIQAMDILLDFTPSMVAAGQLSGAFQVLTVTERTAYAHEVNGTIWVELLGGNDFVSRVRKSVKDAQRRMVREKNRAMLDKQMSQLYGQAVQQVLNENAAQTNLRRRLMSGAR